MSVTYPNPDPERWPEFGRLTLPRRLAIAWRDRRWRRRAPSARGIALAEVGPLPAAPSAREPVALFTVRDGMATLPSFLAHHRRLGVRHFAAVDDGSVDGSAAFLAAQGDVALFTSNVGFRAAGGGLVWRDQLVDRFGRGRWYLSVDCDEYLVFPGCEMRPLAAFLADLERAGLKRAMAPMLDLYPDGPIGALAPPVDPAAFPAESCPFFDGSHYTVDDEKFCTSIRGGPRNRLYATPMRMTKFPLVFADRELAFAGGSHHGPLPLARNFAPPDAVLLHHKFAPGSVETFRQIAERGSHFNGSQFYKDILDSGAFGPQTDFRYENSVRFRSSDDLVARGFLRDLRTA